MALNSSEARSNYEDGINRASGNPYREAAGVSSIKEAAEIMEDAFSKGGSVDMNQMASNWADKYD